MYRDPELYTFICSIRAVSAATNSAAKKKYAKDFTHFCRLVSIESTKYGSARNAALQLLAPLRSETWFSPAQIEAAVKMVSSVAEKMEPIKCSI